MNKTLANAVNKLAANFNNINWRYLDVPSGSPREKTQLWPYAPSDDVAICVYKGHEIRELFHRQNFFFFNFAYKGNYSALSYAFNNRITVREGECYIGQPYAGYAINDKSESLWAFLSKQRRFLRRISMFSRPMKSCSGSS